nr:MAG: replication-associated protein [Gemykibivirus]
MPNPVSFKLRYALLTYSQCGELDPFEVVNHLAGLRAECIIGRENHQNEGIHLHAFVDFGRTFRSRRVDVFDVEGRHPNVRHIGKTPWLAYDYAIKDGDVVAGGATRPDESGVPVSAAGDVWPTIMGAASSTEFFELCAQLAPRSLCTSFNSLQAYASWKYRVDPEPYTHPAGFEWEESAVAELNEWAVQNLGGSQRERKRSLVLYGPTRLGKTLWARSLGRHAYFGGLFSLDESVKDVDYAVFDDMQGGLDFFHSYKFWLGCQYQFYATDKYKGKKLVTWGRPSIYLCNYDPRQDKLADVNWLEGNCVFIYVGEKLFK